MTSLSKCRGLVGPAHLGAQVSPKGGARTGLNVTRVLEAPAGVGGVGRCRGRGVLEGGRRWGYIRVVREDEVRWRGSLERPHHPGEDYPRPCHRVVPHVGVGLGGRGLEGQARPSGLRRSPQRLRRVQRARGSCRVGHRSAPLLRHAAPDAAGRGRGREGRLGRWGVGRTQGCGHGVLLLLLGLGAVGLHFLHGEDKLGLHLLQGEDKLGLHLLQGRKVR